MLPGYGNDPRVVSNLVDGVLRTFEGTHKFHNFASGLRKQPQEYEAGGETWPLALDISTRSSAAWRASERVTR